MIGVRSKSFIKIKALETDKNKRIQKIFRNDDLDSYRIQNEIEYRMRQRKDSNITAQ